MPSLHPSRKDRASSSSKPAGKKKRVVLDEELYTEKHSDHLCLHFALQTNIDGCSKPWSTNVLPLQIVWIVILLVATLCTIYLVAMVIYDYFQFDSNVQYIREYGSVTFPAVTICNANVIVHPTTTSITASEEQKHRLQQIASARRKWPPLYGESLQTRKSSSARDEHSLDFFMWNLEDELVLCYYHRRPCNISDFKIRKSWLGNCYTFEVPQDELSPTNIVAGSGNGLYMIVDVNYDIVDDPLNFEPDFPINITDIGLRVAVHAVNEPSLAESRSIPVGPAQHLYLSLKQTTLIEMEPPYGKCSQHMNYTSSPEGNPHTNAGCTTDCKNKLLAERCECLPYYLFSDEFPQYDVCDDSGYDCMRKEKVNIEADFGVLCQHCTIGCLENRYDMVVSYAPILQRMRDGTLNETKLIVIDVFYGDTARTIIQREAAMNTGTLFANIGGNLGLLLGASVITLCEVVEIAILWLIRRCRMVRHQIFKPRQTSQREVLTTIDEVVCSSKADNPIFGISNGHLVAPSCSDFRHHQHLSRTDVGKPQNHPVSGDEAVTTIKF